MCIANTGAPARYAEPGCIATASQLPQLPLPEELPSLPSRRALGLAGSTPAVEQARSARTRQASRDAMRRMRRARHDESQARAQAALEAAAAALTAATKKMEARADALEQQGRQLAAGMQQLAAEQQRIRDMLCGSDSSRTGDSEEAMAWGGQPPSPFDGTASMAPEGPTGGIAELCAQTPLMWQHGRPGCLPPAGAGGKGDLLEQLASMMGVA